MSQSEIETRSVELRADAESGIVSGIAVPWNQRANIGGQYVESFERGAISDSGDIKLFFQHREVIGKVIETEDRDEGFFIRAKISDTTQGRDARTLLKDGVIDRFSVGFIPVESRTDDDGTVIRTAVNLKEVSAVVFPAYSGATVSEAREAVTQIKENPMSDNTDNNDLAEVRDGLEALDRRFEVFSSELQNVTSAPAVDTRSAGQVLKDIVSGDERTIDEVAKIDRAYTGGTLSDGYTPNAYVGDLTRLIDNASPVRSVFAQGTLPSTGKFLEYTQLKTNTVSVGEQLKEGDVLTYGNVSVESKTAPIKTYGGYSALSRQEIERSNVPMLNLTLNAQTIAAARALDAVFRNEFNSAVADSRAAGNFLAKPANTAAGWINLIVDAAGKFRDNGLTLDGLLVDGATFKTLIALAGSDGRPLMAISGQAVNTIGSAVPRTLRGEIAGVSIIGDTALDANSVAFYNTDAIREYRSPIVRLSDQDITNLTSVFSLYFYGAVAHELPVGIVPVGAAA